MKLGAATFHRPASTVGRPIPTAPNDNCRGRFDGAAEAVGVSCFDGAPQARLTLLGDEPHVAITRCSAGRAD